MSFSESLASKQVWESIQLGLTSVQVTKTPNSRDSLQTQLTGQQDPPLPSPQLPAAVTSTPQPASQVPPVSGHSPAPYSFSSQPSLTFPDVASPDGSSPTWFGSVHSTPEGIVHPGGSHAFPGAQPGMHPQGFPMQGALPGAHMQSSPMQGLQPGLHQQGPSMQIGMYHPVYQPAEYAANSAVMYKRNHDAMNEGPQGPVSGGE